MGIRPARGKKDDEPKKPQRGPRPANAEFFETNSQGAYIVPDFEDVDKKGEVNHYCRAHLTDKHGNHMRDGQGNLLMCPQNGNFSSRRSLRDHLCRTHREQGRPVEVQRSRKSASKSPSKLKRREGQARAYSAADNLTFRKEPSSLSSNGHKSDGDEQYEYPSPSHGNYDWKEESRQPRIFGKPAPQYHGYVNERSAGPEPSRPSSTTTPVSALEQQHDTHVRAAYHEQVALHVALGLQYQDAMSQHCPANSSLDVGRGDCGTPPPRQRAAANYTPQVGLEDSRAQPTRQHPSTLYTPEYSDANNVTSQQPGVPSVTHPISTKDIAVSVGSSLLQPRPPPMIRQLWGSLNSSMPMAASSVERA